MMDLNKPEAIVAEIREDAKAYEKPILIDYGAFADVIKLAKKKDGY
jgi:hypothetical protein